jgi:hypothetical protein
MLSIRASLLSCLGLAASCVVAAAQGPLDLREFIGDRCIAGMRPLTIEEAMANRDEVCGHMRKLGEWSILRLAEGAAVGGPGYQCNMLRNYTAVPVGATLCTSRPAPPTTLELVQRFAPELRFDRAAVGYPMSAQPFYDAIQRSLKTFPDNRDGASLRRGTIPTYYQVRVFGNQTRILYWWFYGYQHPCWQEEGQHYGDWERVMVTLTENRSGIAAVTYWQHNGWYTRIAGPRDAPCTPGGTGRCGGSGGFERSGTHPVVYVGKFGHGSYHDTNAAGPHGAGVCAYYGDFRNPESRNDYLETWNKLIDLDGNAEPWIAADRTTWGPGGISNHPTQHPPEAGLQACAGSPTYAIASAGCYKSECLAGDDEASEDCLKECKPGYDNAGLTCNKGKWPWEWSIYGRLTGGNKYGYRYTLPTRDVGLSRRRGGEDEWSAP